MNDPEEIQQTPDTSGQSQYAEYSEAAQGVKIRARYFLHLSLFAATFFTTTVAGVEWLNQDPFDLANFSVGVKYSFAILFILASHEFGHYFAARIHNVRATLPYFIPFPAMPGFLNFGTLGAVIRIRSAVPSRKALFDIGVAGPIAGFIATLLILSYGFLTLPSVEDGISFIRSISGHENFTYPIISERIENLVFGRTALYTLLEKLLASSTRQFIPPMGEMYHFPFLCVGWFGLFVTAMNLIPIGQLDGGHIAYTMFGEQHKIITRFSFGIITTLGVAGFLPLVGVKTAFGWTGWLFWGAILYFIVKIDHPPIASDELLNPNRMMIGWLVFVMLLVCFSPIPFILHL